MSRHTYNLSDVELNLQLILSSIGIRASARAVEITNHHNATNENGSPSWYTGRLWLMKLGLYKLNETKVQANDWIWIADHSIQLGTEKVLVVLGIRAINIPEERALAFSDMIPLGLFISKNTNGEKVAEQLQGLAKEYGEPMHIVSDGGPDLKSGIDTFINRSSNTKFIYDIKHKIAIHLKKLLSSDKSWLSFCELCSKAQGYMRQTDNAALAPPNQRSKSRYMNIDRLINWAKKVLTLEQSEVIELFDKKKYDSCLSWLNTYKSDIESWERLMRISELVVKHVATYGIYSGIKDAMWLECEAMSTCQLSQQLTDLVVQDIATNEGKLKPGYKTIGSSDVIESLFGCYKNLEKQQAASGFTSLILAIPALVGDKSKAIVKKAMEGIKIKHIKSWVRENIGLSVQAKRKLCMG